MRNAVIMLVVLSVGVLAIVAALTTGGGNVAPPSRPEADPAGGHEKEPGELGDAGPGDSSLVDVTGKIVRLGSREPIARAEVGAAGVDGLSDEDGGFELDGVAAGEADLRVRVEGRPEFVTKVTIAPDAPDLGEIEVPSGTVLAGLVKSADGTPVVGGTVRIIDRSRYRVGTPWSGPKEDQFKMGVEVFDGGKPMPGIRIATGDDGRFRVEDISPGKYHVSAKGPGLAWAEQDEVEVAEGGLAEVELSLPDSTAIRGVVLDTRKRPIGGARILACPWNRASLLPYASMEETKSGPDGAFTASHLVSGTNYFILVRAPDGRIGIGVRKMAPGDGIEIMVGPRFTVAGTVVDDATGAPIEGAKLFALLAHTTTDEHGAYRLEGVVKSAFLRWVWIEAEGYEGDTHEIDLVQSLIGGEEIQQDFRLKKVRPGRLEVRAEGMDGEPVAGVAVLVTLWEEKDTIVAKGTTNSSGEVVLDDVPPEGLNIRAMKPGHVLVQPRQVSENEPGAQLAEVVWSVMPPGGDVEVVVHMVRTGVLRGRVLDPDGEPIEGVRLSSLEVELGATDAEGGFSVRKVPAGIATSIAFFKPGFIGVSEWLVAGTDVEARVVMARGGTISGVVLDDDGKPVPGAEIEAKELSTKTSSSRTRSAQDGSFAVRSLPEGRYLLLVDHDGFAAVKTRPFALGPGATRSGVRIELSRGLQARIYGVSPTGEVVPSSVLAYGPLEVEKDQRVLHRTGYRDLSGVELRLLPGRYRIIATPLAPDAGGGATEVELPIFTDGDVRVELSESSERIVIRPILPEGMVARGMRLTRTEPEEPAASFWFDAGEDGSLESPSLPPGKYRVQVYYGTQDSTSLYAKEFPDIEPGRKPVELDLRDR